MSDGEFLMRYTPDYQREIAEDADGCFFGSYPTLSEVRRDYGREIAIAWLVPQLTNLSEYCGARDKMTEAQMEECAYMIVTEYHHLKISELMLFFHRFKAGRYGKRFFGAVDPLAILEALGSFVQERSEAISRRETAKVLARIDEARRNAVTYEEYIRRHGRVETTGEDEP